uniref:START domain containing protein n=1 Tax=Adineta vaga TaxID=104782 RepID=B2ZF94_ADIVA|nr:START domain containing protein [Adineta vaga]
MRTNTNEINIHLLLSNDINRLREAALSKLLKLTQQNCTHDSMHNHDSITLAKLNKLPKPTTWKGKRVFGVPLRVYQQTTGQILPVAITNALQYVRMNAGKCEGLFRKPGVKSKIDRLRSQIESINDSNSDSSLETIKFDDYQPFVVADVIRQYFRELPECLIPPSITRLLCDLIKCATQEEQLLAIRYVFLLLPDETRDVVETILRFLLDVSIRSGNSQITCRSLARIFVPSIFQSYHDMHNTSSKVLWWKWKKDKLDAIQQESERLTLELCLMTMILNVDLLCRVPNSLSEELKLPTSRKTKHLDDLVRHVCNGEFQMKKYITKDSEQFLQYLSNTKFKNVQTNLTGVDVSIHKPSINTCDSDDINLPVWKCSIDIPNTNVKQVCQRILHERYLWDNHFAESRTVEKIDDDKEIVQYVLNFLDLVPVRSFCEFRFSKKITSRSVPDTTAMLISAVSIDHLQNHFLPGSIGITKDMHYYITPSTTQPGHTTVTQVACVDFSGRSSQWYENVFGYLLANNLQSLRDTFTNSKIVKV